MSATASVPSKGSLDLTLTREQQHMPPARAAAEATKLNRPGLHIRPLAMESGRNVYCRDCPDAPMALKRRTSNKR
jgi:hypothetical protein